MKSDIAGAGSLDGVAPVARGNDDARAGTLANFHLIFVTALVFLLPNAIFAANLRPVMAAIVIAGCAGAGAILWRSPRTGALLSAPLDLPRLTLCLAFALALCLLGGEGHFFHGARDWLMRDAVLSDLLSGGLATYRYEGQDYLLRAPLGMYLLPAVVGRACGLYAAHMALLAQNALILGSILYFAAQLANVVKTPFLILLIGFSGLDILPILVAEAIEMAHGGDFMPFAHIEWWGEYFSPVRLQYSSHVTQLFWVPNHMAPGWWFALLSLLYARREIDLAPLLISFAALLLWSPLAMMGAAPFIALFALEQPPRGLFSPRMFAAAGIAFLFFPIALYLTNDAAAVPHEWLLMRESFALRYISFLAVEIPQAAVVLYAWNKVEAPDRRILALALALLFVIPIYSIGVSNDFVMRVSIAPLFLLAFAFARIAILTPRDNGRFASVISTIVIVSAATPFLEFKQALRGNYAISDCNLLTSWHKGDISDLPLNYWARVEKVPAWLMSPPPGAPLMVEDRKCWPDHPALPENLK
jgi:hypothetical protein